MDKESKNQSISSEKIISNLEEEINFYDDYKKELLKELEEQQWQINLLEKKFKDLDFRYKKGLKIFEDLTLEVQKLTNEIRIIDYGVYKPIFNFDDTETYQKELEYIIGLQKEMVKDNIAATCSTVWSVDGSKVKGRAMTNRNIQLILRAFNGECNAIMAKVKWDNYELFLERLKRIYKKINSLGQSNLIEISEEYFNLKVKELQLVCEYDLKKKAEKEEERALREERKEEEKALRDIEKERRRAELEEIYYQKALKKVEIEIEYATGARLENLTEKISYLQEQLREAQENKERALSMAQQTRRGYVYVISNIGSFGENVYKIGMTRRLDPNDRIRELSNASVPFKYDIHAMIFSEDAPSLEAKLHSAFEGAKVNKVNGKKEFFRVSLSEIEKVVENSGIKVEFVRIPEARDFRESMKESNERSTLEESIHQEIISKKLSSLYDYELIEESEIE